jgi:hypothetical protein
MSRSSLIAAAVAFSALGFVFACTTEVIQEEGPAPDGGKSDARIGSSGSSGGEAGGGGTVEAPCGEDCATTYCAKSPKQPNTKCNACLQEAISEGGECEGPVTAACEDDEDCVALNKCLQECQEDKGECKDAVPDQPRAEGMDAGDGGDAGDAGDAGTTPAPVDAGSDAGPQACSTCCLTKHQSGAQTLSGAARECGCGL